MCVGGADDVQFGRALGRLRWENIVAESAMVRSPALPAVQKMHLLMEAATSKSSRVKMMPSLMPSLKLYWLWCSGGSDDGGDA